MDPSDSAAIDSVAVESDPDETRKSAFYSIVDRTRTSQLLVETLDI
jgi:hypothetical protein